MSNQKVSNYELQERRVLMERLLLRGLKPCEIIRKIGKEKYGNCGYENESEN